MQLPQTSFCLGLQRTDTCFVYVYEFEDSSGRELQRTRPPVLKCLNNLKLIDLQYLIGTKNRQPTQQAQKY